MFADIAFVTTCTYMLQVSNRQRNFMSCSTQCDYVVTTSHNDYYEHKQLGNTAASGDIYVIASCLFPNNDLSRGPTSYYSQFKRQSQQTTSSSDAIVNTTSIRLCRQPGICAQKYADTWLYGDIDSVCRHTAATRLCLNLSADVSFSYGLHTYD